MMDEGRAAAAKFDLPDPRNMGEGEYEHVLEWVGMLLANRGYDIENQLDDGLEELTREQAADGVQELMNAAAAVIKLLVPARRTTVWVLEIIERHDVFRHVYATEAGARAHLLEYVEKQWEEDAEPDIPKPTTPEALISDYFETGDDPRYELTECPVETP